MKQETVLPKSKSFLNLKPQISLTFLSLGMATSISLKPTNLLLSSFSTGKVLHLRRSRFSHRPSPSSSYRRTLVAQFGFSPGSVSLDLIKDHVESLLYTIADAAVSSSETFDSFSGTTTTTTTNQNSDWFTGIANYMETILKVIKVSLFFLLEVRVSELI